MLRRFSPVLAAVLVLVPGLTSPAQATQDSSPPPPSTFTAEPDGDALLAQGQFLQAIQAYSRLPVDADTLNKIGVAWHHLSAVNNAKRNYEEALLLRPEYPEAINNLGSAYFVERNYREALRLYQRAFALDPQSAIIAANLGTAYFAEDKAKAGLEAYRTAWSLDPSVLDFDPTSMIEGATPKRIRARRDYSLAKVFAEQKVDERALDYLRRAMAEGFRDWRRLMRDPAFAQLRETPEFAKFMMGV